MKRKFGLSFSLVILVILSLLAIVMPATPVMADGGQPITITGDYTLTSDMTFGITGFIIEADNVTLDLNGYTITGPQTNTNGGSGVAIHSDGVTVKNGTIKGFYFGIAVNESSNNAINSIVVMSVSFFCCHPSYSFPS